MIRMKGKDYESQEFSLGDVNKILNIRETPYKNLKKLMVEGLKGELEGSLVDFARQTALDTMMVIRFDILFVMGVICKNELEVLVFLADISEKFGKAPTLTEIGSSLYPQGFYTKESISQRITQILDDAANGKFLRKCLSDKIIDLLA